MTDSQNSPTERNEPPASEFLTDDEQRYVDQGMPEAFAAERVDEGACQYDDCDNDADYRVWVELAAYGETATTLMCDDCSQENRIWVAENELLDAPTDDLEVIE